MYHHSISGFSKSGLYEQLTFEVGDKFTSEETLHTLDNLSQ
ncbi:MAG: Ltp family lipoprotein [Clostridiales bacterium]|nr:Ltp family lipoprotein [Clostridiales bacterium]